MLLGGHVLQRRFRIAALYVLSLAIGNILVGVAANWHRIADPSVPASDVMAEIFAFFLFSLPGLYWAYGVVTASQGVASAVRAGGPFMVYPHHFLLLGVLVLSPISGYLTWRRTKGVWVVKRAILAYLAFTLASGFGPQIYPPS